MHDISIRPGSVHDEAGLTGLFDTAIAWLTAQGIPGQWGTLPASRRPRFAAQVREYTRHEGLYIAMREAAMAGALVVGEAPDYVPAATEPELYVRLLITDRGHSGHGIGARLLRHAETLAGEGGARLLRVDCYAGAERRLVKYYRGQGFEEVDSFTVDKPDGPWPGAILIRRW